MRLLDAVEYFKAEWIAIHPVRCLNPRHRIASCDVCVKVCPQQAITVSTEDVVIDPALCNNCGLCVADCPTGVFAHDYFDGLDLVRWARGKPEIELHCQMSGPPELGPGQARIPCHGMLDAPLLAALKGVGVQRMRLCGLSQCESCPTQVGQQRIVDLIQESRESDAWPALLFDGHDGLSRDDESDQADGALHAEPVTSRRGFFRQVARKGAEGVASATFIGLLEQDEETVRSQAIGVDEDALMTKYVPVHHRLSLTALAAGNARGVAGQLHNIAASDACTGCQVCAIRCPTGALSWQDDGDTVALNYRTAACIGCGLCVKLCPYDALNLHAQEDAAAVLADERVRLFASEQLTCEQCGDRFLPHDGDNRYCWICKNEMEMDDQWMSFLKTPGAD